MTATTESLHLPAGSAAAGPYALEVTPESAGWAHSGLRILELPAGGAHTLETGPDEVVVVPLQGGLLVECDGQTLELAGRRDVFAGPTDFAYLPAGGPARLRSAGGGPGAPPPPAAAGRRAGRRRAGPAGSPSGPPARAPGCRCATARRPTSRSSCAAPA